MKTAWLNQQGATAGQEEAVVEPGVEQATEPAAEQVVEKVTAKEAEAEKTAEPVAEKAEAKTSIEDKAAKQSVAEPAVKLADLEITRVAICRQVVDREPVDEGTSFESSVERLACFTM